MVQELGAYAFLAEDPVLASSISIGLLITT